ncbi:bifunctional diguanylate cyclase/phosphodiesterase [Roseibium suaedae]|uniref:Diguanylate cyclase/phosphodiesterase n=1 Tax=Roseibium suaedae TaxID=735517 RepID=A0A1M7GNX4_9HYPH|nr:bifunctional diguanylate cyclase/phosphodiesterase [Roseibium suaedae]SHM17865.1 diguanylate cyclase/phosphodiesterase [Roseibium suaedae]
MLSVVTCIAVDHELRFILLAALVCVIGSVLTMNLLGKMKSMTGAGRLLWLFLIALVGGATIWTTHFSAMMGYIVPFNRTFEPYLTLLSLASAIFTTGAGFYLATISKDRIYGQIAGGCVFGFGVALMHYTGMQAYLIPGQIIWDHTMVVWSVIFGGGLGGAAMVLACSENSRTSVLQASLVMVLSIVLMHFTGMTAITIEPIAGVEIPAQAISDDIMLLAVVSVTLLIIATVASAFAIHTRSLNEASAAYQHLALHDPLTHLPNRLYLRSRLEELLQQVDESAQLAVITVDLDRFKDVNDVHGHKAGDELLREIGRRVGAILRPGEFMARVGGDEFVACKFPICEAGEALAFAERLRREIVAPFGWDHQLITVGGSFGVVVAPRDGKLADNLLAKADMAAYSAKNAGGDRMSLYSEGMEEFNRARAAMAIDLKTAVRKGQLELLYQPQNETSTRKLKGFEALLRWNHPERGLIMPSEFIPIAESTGLILELGNWVLEQACRQAATWPETYTVAVNVSPMQLAQDTLPLQVAAVLGRTGLSPKRLEIEITESGLISDQHHALKIVQELKDLGVCVTMDDFGTGYSSLATLQAFPFDKIKIDRGFVMSLTSNEQSAAIVKSTILLGSSLRIPVLAEGVETEDQLSFLQEEGCEAVQGYLFGKPLPHAECLKLMRTDPTYFARSTLRKKQA